MTCELPLDGGERRARASDATGIDAAVQAGGTSTRPKQECGQHRTGEPRCLDEVSPCANDLHACGPILAATRMTTIDSLACMWLFAEGRGFYTGGAICCSGVPEQPLGIDVGLS